MPTAYTIGLSSKRSPGAVLCVASGGEKHAHSLWSAAVSRRFGFSPEAELLLGREKKAKEKRRESAAVQREKAPQTIED
jgi:hypothetical protein